MFKFEYLPTASGLTSVWCDGRVIGHIRVKEGEGYQYRPAGPRHSWGEVYKSLRTLKADLEAE